MRRVDVREVPGGESAGKMLLPNGTYLGWYDGPVLVSNYYPHEVPSDGATVAATKVQAFLAACGSVKIPGVLLPGTYNVDTPLAGASDLTLYGYGATFTFTDAGASTRCLDFQGVSRVRILGLEVDGNKAAFGVTTEQKHAIRLIGCDDVLLEDVFLHDAKGDGLYVGPLVTNTDSPSTSVTLRRVVCDGNHRNGATVISVDGLTAEDCRFVNASGTAPQAGLDIEPNFDTEVCRDIVLDRCSFVGNAGNGLFVSLKPDGTGEQGNIRLWAPVIRGNGLAGVELYRSRDVTLRDATIMENTLDGVWIGYGDHKNITIAGGKIALNGRHGINVRPHDVLAISGAASNVRILDADVLDNGASAPNTSSGIELQNDGAGTIDGVLIDGVRSGNAATSNQARGLNAGPKATNLTLINSDLSNNATSNASLNDTASTRVVSNVRGLSTTANVTTDTTLNSFARFASVNAGAALTITLPSSPETGDYTIFDAVGNAAARNITVVANTGQTIRNAASVVLATNFGMVRLYHRANSWYVVAKTP